MKTLCSSEAIRYIFTARCYAERSFATARSVCLPVCMSVTLRYRGQIHLNSSKIISWMISSLSSLCRFQHTDLLRREHPEILAGIGGELWKHGFRRTKVLMSLKRGKIGPRWQGYCWGPIGTRKSYALSIGTKINDPGWPWRVIMHYVSKHVHYDVVTYLYSFTFNLLLGVEWVNDCSGCSTSF